MSELEQKISELTHDLARADGQLRMLGEMARTVASGVDFDMALKRILAVAVEIAGADHGTIYEYDEANELFVPRATHVMGHKHESVWRATPVHLGEGEAGRAGVTGKPWEVADVRVVPAECDGPMREIAIRAGFHAVVAVPIMRGRNVVGAIVVWRRAPGAFGKERIELLQIAAQSILALQSDRRTRMRDAANQNKAQFEALRMAAQLIEAFPNPIFFKGTDGCYLGVNKAWEAYFGIPREEFVGKTVHDLYPDNPGFADRLHTQDQELCMSSGSREYETEIKTRDGKRHDVIYYKATFTRADGGVAGLIGTIVDITARKQIEKYRSVEDAVTRVLSEAETPSAAFTKVIQIICDRLGWACGTHWCWDEQAQLLRYGQTWHIDAQEVEKFATSRSARVIEAPAWQGEPPKTDMRGPVFHVWGGRASMWFRDVTSMPGFRLGASAATAGLRGAFAFPVLAGSKPLGVMEFYSRETGELDEDLLHIMEAIGRQLGQFTRRRESEARSSELEEANINKSQFMATMSHELRTPLNAIIGYSEMLLEDAVERESKQFVSDLEKIHTSGKNLLELINDILDLSKIEAGKMELHPEEFEIASLVAGVAETIRPAAQKNGNQVTIDCAPNLGAMHADVTRVRQVLLNLVSNSAKFTQNGTITIVGLRHAAVPGSETIVLQVRDSGIGMTAEQIGKLFRDFEQADGSTTRKYGGTGLGLSISRRFCRMMGGDIIVQSTLGRGSTFTIQLPCVVAAQAKHEPAARRAPVSTMVSKNDSAHAPSVLVVDSDMTVREIMERLLQRIGFTVITAATGIEALALAKEHRPDAITLEVVMPDIDGWTVLAAIKGDPLLAHIPVVLVTIVDEKQRGYELGAANYLVKPIDRSRLAAILQSLCGRNDAPRLLMVDDNE